MQRVAQRGVMKIIGATRVLHAPIAPAVGPAARRVATTVTPVQAQATQLFQLRVLVVQANFQIRMSTRRRAELEAHTRRRAELLRLLIGEEMLSQDRCQEAT